MELLILLPLLPVSKYVSTSRSDVIATASVIAPFISIFVLLVADFRLFASIVFLFIGSRLLLLLLILFLVGLVAAVFFDPVVVVFLFVLLPLYQLEYNAGLEVEVR